MLKLFVNYIVYYILNLLHPILVSVVIKILSWEPPKQKPNTVRARVSKKLAVPETIQETVPPIKLTNLKPSLDYKQILKEQSYQTCKAQEAYIDGHYLSQLWRSLHFHILQCHHNLAW
jgi:hypothetical protein